MIEPRHAPVIRMATHTAERRFTRRTMGDLCAEMLDFSLEYSSNSAFINLRRGGFAQPVNGEKTDDPSAEDSRPRQRLHRSCAGPPA
jgi:hypothetical protein